jgi:PEP-CTERM motif-containing protein
MSRVQNLLKVLAVPLALMTFGSTASAVPVEWTFNADVAFDDGGGLFVQPGFPSFIFDAQDGPNGTYSPAILVQTTAGTAITQNKFYFSLHPFFASTETQLNLITSLNPDMDASDLSDEFALLLGFSTPLTDLGGTVDINVSGAGFSSGEAACLLSDCSNFETVNSRFLTAGSLTGVPVPIVPPPTNVPEPPALALFFAGLGGLAVFARRRKMR